jgi:hypothetical protein
VQRVLTAKKVSAITVYREFVEPKVLDSVSDPE